MYGSRHLTLLPEHVPSNVICLVFNTTLWCADLCVDYAVIGNTAHGVYSSLDDNNTSLSSLYDSFAAVAHTVLR